MQDANPELTSSHRGRYTLLLDPHHRSNLAMKTWKLLKSLSERDVITIGSNILQFGDFFKKLQSSISDVFSQQKTLATVLQEQGLLSLKDSYSYLIDNICIEEDEPSLLEILNNPELVTPQKIDSIISASKKKGLRLERQKTLGISGEVLQIERNWKPCKVVLKMQLEVYVEDEEEDPAPTMIEPSPLDDIRQSYGNLTNLTP
jgi:hypothetical protein